MKTLQITQQKAIQLYPSASGEFKTLLEKEFGVEALTINIKDIVKSYDDACNVLCVDPSINFSASDTKDEVAYKKLKVIAKALNQGWEPDWTNSQEYKYYPWFNLSSGSGLAFHGYDNYYSSSAVGSRLCFKSRELAEYAGKQFIDIYSDFMTI